MGLVCKLIEEHRILRSRAFRHMCGSFRSSCIIGLASSSSCINARSKIDKRVDKVNIVTQDSVQTLRQMAYVTVEDLYIGFGPFDLQTKL